MILTTKKHFWWKSFVIFHWCQFWRRSPRCTVRCCHFRRKPSKNFCRGVWRKGRLRR